MASRPRAIEVPEDDAVRRDYASTAVLAVYPEVKNATCATHRNEMLEAIDEEAYATIRDAYPLFVPPSRRAREG